MSSTPGRKSTQQTDRIIYGNLSIPNCNLEMCYLEKSQKRAMEIDAMVGEGRSHQDPWLRWVPGTHVEGNPPPQLVQWGQVSSWARTHTHIHTHPLKCSLSFKLEETITRSPTVRQCGALFAHWCPLGFVCAVRVYTACACSACVHCVCSSQFKKVTLPTEHFSRCVSSCPVEPLWLTCYQHWF